MTPPNARRHTLAGTSSRRVHADATDRRQSEPNVRAAAAESAPRRRSSLLAELSNERRRLSALLADPEAERTPLEQDFKGLISKLEKEKTREVAAVQQQTRTWRAELFDRHDEQEQLRMYRELVNDVLPPFLADHVKSKRSAMIWDALMTIKTVLWSRVCGGGARACVMCPRGLQLPSLSFRHA